MIARAGWIAFLAINAVTVLILLVPLVLSVLVSFNAEDLIGLPSDFSLRWFERFFSDFVWIEAMTNTFIVAQLTILLSLPISISAAVAVTRKARRWRSTLDSLIMIPLFVPPVILGVSSLTFHREIGLWGGYLSLAVMHSLWAVPLCYVVLKMTLEGLDRSIEEAAAGLGASPIRVFWEVTLPMIAGGIFVGVLFIVIVSTNEFVMSLFLAVPDTRTLPVAIWPQLKYLVTPLIAAASTVLIVITISLLLLTARLVNIQKLLTYR